MTSWRHETRLPANQPCFFGYGTDRPRKGDRNACAAFKKNTRDKSWRTEALLRGTIGELCGRSQAGKQRALEILARPAIASAYCCKNCFEDAVKKARAFTALNPNTLRPAANTQHDVVRPRRSELSLSTAFGSDAGEALRLQLLQSCGGIGDAARLAATCRYFFKAYMSPPFQRYIEEQA